MDPLTETVAIHSFYDKYIEDPNSSSFVVIISFFIHATIMSRYLEILPHLFIFRFFFHFRTGYQYVKFHWKLNPCHLRYNHG